MCKRLLLYSCDKAKDNEFLPGEKRTNKSRNRNSSQKRSKLTFSCLFRRFAAENAAENCCHEKLKVLGPLHQMFMGVGLKIRFRFSWPSGHRQELSPCSEELNGPNLRRVMSCLLLDMLLIFHNSPADFALGLLSNYLLTRNKNNHL